MLLASRSDLGRLVRFIREAEVTVEQVGALVNRLRNQGDLEFEANDDKDRILLAVAERAGALTLQPGSGNRIRVRLTSDRIDRAKVAQLCRAATDRRWQSYRSIEHYAATGDRCRRRQLLDHFGDSSPGAPLGRCCDVHDPPDWLPPISAKPKKLAPVEDGPPVSDAELAPLKAWRRERADGKPAYTVATDATLREVVRRQPRSSQELLQIKGIGASFIDKHADSLLELLESSVAVGVRLVPDPGVAHHVLSDRSGAQPSPERALALDGHQLRRIAGAGAAPRRPRSRARSPPARRRSPRAPSSRARTRG